MTHHPNAGGPPIDSMAIGCPLDAVLAPLSPRGTSPMIEKGPFAGYNHLGICSVLATIGVEGGTSKRNRGIWRCDRRSGNASGSDSCFSWRNIDQLRFLRTDFTDRSSSQTIPKPSLVRFCGVCSGTLGDALGPSGQMVSVRCGRAGSDRLLRHCIGLGIDRGCTRREGHLAMSLTLYWEQRLRDAELIRYFDGHRAAWLLAAREAMQYTRSRFPHGAPIRRDDVAQFLVNVIEVDDGFKNHLAEHRLTSEILGKTFRRFDH